MASSARPCLICGTLMLIGGGRGRGRPRKYCSVRCCQSRPRELERMRRRNRARKEPRKGLWKNRLYGMWQPGSCLVCGDDCNTAKLTCSQECKLIRKGQRPRNWQIFQCRWCGNEYTPRRHDAVWCCSRECGLPYSKAMIRQRYAWGRAFIWDEPTPVTRSCIECGKRIVASFARYCSDSCRDRRRRRLAIEQRERLIASHVAPECECTECGSVFRPGYGDLRRVFCSDACRGRHTRRTRWKKLGEHRKRARHYGVLYEPVNVRRVLSRDNWRCGICRQRISKRASWPDQMCASLDHIIPMSQGGGHTYDNVQAAHWRCNVDKGNGSAGEQLLLVG